MDERSRTVARVLAVLEQLSVSAKPLTNVELSRALKVPASSMFRLLQKLVDLGYAEFNPSDTTYGIGSALADLATRLADAGGRSPPLRRMMVQLHKETGYNVTVWVPNGAQVRIASLLLGKVPGAISQHPGVVAAPFSTPGLAIASQYSAEELRALVAYCHRRRTALGRRYRTITDVTRALQEVRRRGFASGYNMQADGWGILAWPVPLTLSPRRIGALALAAPVAGMRREEPQLAALAARLLEGYLREQQAALSANAVRA